MTGLDDRVRRALQGLPGPSGEARDRAERAAIDALPAAPGRGRRRWALAAAAAVAAIVVAGAALAATDRLDVRIGAPAPQERRPATAAIPAGEARLPDGARGLALVAGGRLWLATRNGVGVQGLPVGTAELSPNALYAAVGVGRSLVAIAPDGRRAWTHPAPGPVVAAAWAPNPIVIAYVARRGGGYELRVIEGDGDGDRLVDRDVAPVRPTWRADSQALAYVAGDGAARVATYPSLAVRPVAAPPPGIAAAAYAPEGGRLALATAGPGFAVALRGGGAPGGWLPLGEPGGRVTALGWSSPGELLVAGDDPRRAVPARLWTLIDAGGLSGKPAGVADSAAPVLALAPIGGDGRPAVAVRAGEEVQVWEAAAPEPGAAGALRLRRLLLRVAAPRGPVTLSVR